MICSLCGTTATPCWREGPEGPRTLCNACGIRWKRDSGTARPRKRKPSISHLQPSPESGEPKMKKPRVLKKQEPNSPSSASPSFSASEGRMKIEDLFSLESQPRSSPSSSSSSSLAGALISSSPSLSASAGVPMTLPSSASSSSKSAHSKAASLSSLSATASSRHQTDRSGTPGKHRHHGTASSSKHAANSGGNVAKKPPVPIVSAKIPPSLRSNYRIKGAYQQKMSLMPRSKNNLAGAELLFTLRSFKLLEEIVDQLEIMEFQQKQSAFATQQLWDFLSETGDGGKSSIQRCRKAARILRNSRYRILEDYLRDAEAYLSEDDSNHSEDDEDEDTDLEEDGEEEKSQNPPRYVEPSFPALVTAASWLTENHLQSPDQSTDQSQRPIEEAISTLEADSLAEKEQSTPLDPSFSFSVDEMVDEVQTPPATIFSHSSEVINS